MDEFAAPTAAPGVIADADWPTFGWDDDVRPALARARAAGRPAALATLYAVEGSAPRGPGAQMLFDGAAASGYFSGDCIEGDVAAHAAQVLADGAARRLHYGAGSPWIDLRLRCGGALHVFVERMEAGDKAVERVLKAVEAREAVVYDSDGTRREVRPAQGAPLLSWSPSPLAISRRYDPRRRLVVSGGDPGALALARLGSEAGLETWLVRPDGPAGDPPFRLAGYLRESPQAALDRLGPDRWTAFVGATHEDEHDLPALAAAITGGVAYAAMIGARSRAPGRLAVLEQLGLDAGQRERARMSPGVAGLGKQPWAVATGILAEVLGALNAAAERA